jgi:large subunit ribosomal protein L16
LTKKPLLSRMGKGSGSIDSWISYIKKGKIFIEILDLDEKILDKLLKAVQVKINLKIEIVKREIFDA